LRLYNWSSFLTGIVVIVLGVIMLLNNFGVLSINVGDLISIYWPLLLVIWGIDMMFPGAGAASKKSRKNRGKPAAGLAPAKSAGLRGTVGPLHEAPVGSLADGLLWISLGAKATETRDSAIKRPVEKGDMPEIHG